MPENPETIAALKATIAAQAETIAYLKWALGIICGAGASAGSFLVAWIRTLYDRREAQATEENARRDRMLERLLEALGTVGRALDVVKAKAGVS